tara:strand:+ start:264 stop:950 length:687 start_codon:yes stop_codon:yes gene_type:complete
MAKELPYFKFEPTEYLTGDITLCSDSAQGVFIQLCCFYWSKSCSISLAIAKQRFNNCLNDLNQLLEFDIIKVDEKDYININFLDEQMESFISISSKRAESGRKGAIAKQMPSKSKASANIEEKRRVEEIREDKSILKKDILERKNEFSLQSNQFKNNYSEKIIKEFIDYWTESNLQGKKMKYEMQKTFDINLRLKKWYENSLKFGQNSKPQNKTNTYTSNNFKYEDKL